MDWGSAKGVVKLLGKLTVGRVKWQVGQGVTFSAGGYGDRGGWQAHRDLCDLGGAQLTF